MSDTPRPVLTLNRKPKAEPEKNNKDTPIQPVFRRKQWIDAVARPKKNKAAPAVKPSAPVKKTKVPEPLAVKPEKVPVPQTPPKKRMNIIEALGIITRYWPELFPDGQLRPMKIGLKEDLLLDRKVRELPVSVRTLTRCLSSVSYAGGYRLTVIAGAVRYDKDGQPSGTVTPEEDADSVLRMEKLRKQQVKVRPDNLSPAGGGEQICEASEVRCP
ncbi:ProQ/FINO family protein [Morganella morganii]|uniref:ProQ/FINO family protein n=1 Tax=Morganella morganii TaxID=582 RepID=UPI00236869F6|nr:ProQ/FINO family protein [Morganella morganii]